MIGEYALLRCCGDLGRKTTCVHVPSFLNKNIVMTGSSGEKMQ
jgi:hypothetical protein